MRGWRDITIALLLTANMLLPSAGWAADPTVPDSQPSAAVVPKASVADFVVYDASHQSGEVSLGERAAALRKGAALARIPAKQERRAADPIPSTAEAKPAAPSAELTKTAKVEMVAHAPESAVFNESATSAEPAAFNFGGATANAAEPANAAAVPGGGAPARPAAPNIWIWDGPDDQPVQLKTSAPRKNANGFNVLTDTGFAVNIRGNASLGFTSQNQTAAPTYNNLDSGVDIYASGFIYNPRLVNYTLFTRYNGNQMGVGSRDNNMNGLWYGGQLSLLSATNVPVTVAYSQNNVQSDGNLTTPFATDGHTLDVNGSVLGLPANITYRLGDGSSTTKDIAGHFLGYDYLNGAIAVSKTWNGYAMRLGDDYVDSHTRYEGVKSSQINNYLHFNLEKSFQRNLNTYFEFDRTRYDFGYADTRPTKTNVTSLVAGARWHATSKLDVDFTGMYSQNAVNLLELISQSSATQLPNPLPNTAVFDTHSTTLGGDVLYRPWKDWTFGAFTGYTRYKLPDSVLAATPEDQRPRVSGGYFNNGGSVSYSHRFTHLQYDATLAGNIQNQMFAFQSNLDPRAYGYNVGNGVNGGSDDTLRYGVYFTIAQTNNPVFYELLDTNDKILDFDFSSHRLHWIHMDAKLQYRDRVIHYIGQTQDQSAWNFFVLASTRRVDVSLSRITDDATSRYFGIGSPILGGTGAPPVTLFLPLAIAKSTTTSGMLQWHIRKDMELDSIYNQFNYALFADVSTLNKARQIDNSLRYHFGRFDLVGGFVHFDGVTGTYERQMNIGYFRILFPFNIW